MLTFHDCLMPLDDQNDHLASAKEHWFTTTHWSAVLAAQQTAAPQADAALEELCRTYWYPLYAYIRRQGHSPHDAQDFTQEFFALLLQKKYLASVEREKGKFRSFLLAAVNHFLSHQRDHARAAKRGGGKPPLSLDSVSAESRFALEPAAPASSEAAFDKRWAATVLELAFSSVREEFVAAGKERLFERLQAFLGEGATPGGYLIAAEQLGMSPNAFAVAVHRLRLRYREAVRRQVAHTVSNADEIEDEMRHLLSVLAL